VVDRPACNHDYDPHSITQSLSFGILDECFIMARLNCRVLNCQPRNNMMLVDEQRNP
jgi:hypothetical protein